MSDVPKRPGLGRQLADIERRLKNLETSRRTQGGGLEVYDHDGNLIVATMPPEDGHGIKYPVIPGNWATERNLTLDSGFDTGSTYRMDSTSFEDAAVADLDYLSSRVVITALATESGGATASVRVQVDDGNGLVVPDGGESRQGSGHHQWIVTLGAGQTQGWRFASVLRWRMQVRRSAGSGFVGVMPISIRMGGS